MKIGTVKSVVSFGSLVLVALLGAGSLRSQTVTGSVTGEVTDASGAVIPQASVVVENVDTNVKITAATNSAGTYDLRFLSIGRYRETVSATGFVSQTSNVFTLEINQTVKLNAKLAVGSTNSVVEVTDIAPILNTSDGVIGTTFSENEIQTLPLEGRNFQSVALFTPGVINTDPSGMTGQNAIERSQYSNNLLSVNGNRGQANSYTLDGVDLNEPQNNQVSYNPAPDSLQEIRVISGNAPAIYGNVNGGDIVAVLKSGTNKFHGSGYGYLQNWKLNANSWSNKYSTPQKPRNQYTQSTFGGTIGGPVLRDKLFFFGDYEGTRDPTGSTSSVQVLTSAMLHGDFSAYPNQLYNTQAYDPVTNTYPIYANNQVPVNNPVAKFLIAHPSYYPTFNQQPDPGTYIPSFQGRTRSYVTNNQFDAKVDWTPGKKDRISGFYAQSRAGDGSTTIFPIGFSPISSFPTTLFGASWVRTISSAIVNQANVGFTRTKWIQGIPVDRLGTFGTTGDTQVGIPFGTQRYVGFSAQEIAGANTIGTRAAPQLLVDNTYSYVDNFTLQRGHHTYTVGVQAVRYQQAYTQSQNAGALGYFGYSGVFVTNPILGTANFGPADFVQDAVDTEGLQDGGEFGNRQWRAAGYIQDDWKIRPNLTLNLGFRYEYDQPMTEAHDKNANVIPLNGGTVEYAVAVPFGAPAGSIVCPTRACYNPNFKQAMPRIGFAYQPAFNISIRGGYGATSFLEGNAANQRLTNNPPLVSIFARNAVAPSSTTGGSALHASDGFKTNANAFQPSGAAFSKWPVNIQPAYIQQYNLTAETQLNSITSLSIGYVGQTGQHLVDYGNVNQFTQAQAYDVYVNNPAVLPASDLTPYYNLAGNGGAVLITESRAKSNYNAAQVTIRQRQAHGLEYNLNYTWAKSMTNAAGNYGVPNVAQSGTFQDYYNSQADYGVSGDDIRNQFNAVIVYALPYGRGRQFGSSANVVVQELLGGWSLTNGFKAFSGPPVTILANGGNTGSYGSERANQFGQLRIVNRSLNHWFGTDPSATPCLSATANATCAYGQPDTYQFGTAHNGSERAPGYYQLDTSLFKDFRTFREESFGFRADFFNILNVADYGNPDNNIQDTNFGFINSVRNQERRLQLSVNYKF